QFRLNLGLPALVGVRMIAVPDVASRRPMQSGWRTASCVLSSPAAMGPAGSGRISDFDGARITQKCAFPNVSRQASGVFGNQSIRVIRLVRARQAIAQ